MAYENVSVASLERSLRGCKNAINHKKTDDLINTLAVGNSIWKSDSRKTLVLSLKKLSKTRYKELEDKIDDYLRVCTLIKEYQDIQRKNKSLSSSNARLSTSLNKVVNGTVTKDASVESRIKSNNNSIRSNNTKLASLDRQIKSLI